MHVYTYVFRPSSIPSYTLWGLFQNLSSKPKVPSFKRNCSTETDENIEMICKKRDMKHDFFLGFWENNGNYQSCWTWKRKFRPPVKTGDTPRNSLGTYPFWGSREVFFSGQKKPRPHEWNANGLDKWQRQIFHQMSSVSAKPLKNSPKLKDSSTWMSQEVRIKG